MQTQSSPDHGTQRRRHVRQVSAWRQYLTRLRSWAVRALEKLAENSG